MVEYRSRTGYHGMHRCVLNTVESGSEQIHFQEDKIMTAAAGKFRTVDLVYIAVFAVLMAICSWISIPTAVPFTLQVFAVFLALVVLGGKRGTMAILVYILLGMVGVPVFAGFSGGIHVILGTTGGYIVGLLVAGLFYGLSETLFGNKKWQQLVYMLVGLVICYAFGTAWFIIVYGRSAEPVGVMTALGWCVFPFIIPDLIKIGLAWTLAPRIRKAAQLQ